jgi:hypothetical protein
MIISVVDSTAGTAATPTHGTASHRPRTLTYVSFEDVEDCIPDASALRWEVTVHFMSSPCALFLTD